LGLPKAPAIRNDHLAAFARQLRHTPRDALLRDIERIEALAPDIDAGTDYPLDWIAYRVTGYRPEGPSTPVVRGIDLLRDLDALCQHLCVLAALEADELGDGFEPIDRRARAWNVGATTLKRLRRRGLVARRARTGPASWGVFVSARHAEAFAERHPEHFGAPTPARMGKATREAIARAGEALRRGEHLSLNQAARRLAAEHGRSLESVRRVLASRGAFPRKRPVTDRTRAAMLRLWRLGMGAPELARLTGRSAAVARRDVNLARAARLRALAAAGAFAGPHPKTFDRPDAAKLLLAGEGAARIAPEAEAQDLPTLLVRWRSQEPSPAVLERERAGAFHYLRFRALAGIPRVSRLQPQPARLDEIETSLRWASLLARSLLRTQRRLVIDTIEGRTGKRAEELGVPTLTELLHAAAAAGVESLPHFDPFRPGRLAGTLSLAIDRSVVRTLRSLPSPAPGRAAGFIPEGTPAPRLWCRVCLWDRWLGPDERIPHAVARGLVSAEDARLLAERFGLAGEPPRSLADLARRVGVRPTRIVALVQGAVRRAVTARG